jgi:putative lipoprotein
VPPPDGEPIVIAKKVITRPGQVPVAFSLEYDPARIVDGHSYVVSARIADRGQLAFVTESPIPVLAGGFPAAVEILVSPIR